MHTQHTANASVGSLTELLLAHTVIPAAECIQSNSRLMPHVPSLNYPSKKQQMAKEEEGDVTHQHHFEQDRYNIQHQQKSG